MAGAVITTATAALPNKAQSQVFPYMDLPTSQSTTLVGEYSTLNSGREARYRFGVFNKGDGDDSNNDINNPTDGSAYNLISFVIPAGADWCN
jgi:hypothetical protein